MYNFSKQIYGIRRISIYKLPNITIPCTLQKTEQGLGFQHYKTYTKAQYSEIKENSIKINIRNDDVVCNCVDLSSGKI